MQVARVWRPKRQGLSGQQCGHSGDPGGQRVDGASLWDGRENGRKRQKNRTRLPELGCSLWCRKDPGAEEEKREGEREKKACVSFLSVKLWATLSMSESGDIVSIG